MRIIQSSGGRGALAIAGVLATLVPASAVTLGPPEPGSLFVGFRAAGGQGGSSAYLVNIGSDLTYRNAAPGAVFDLDALGVIGADLSTTYGSNWHSRDDLYWGIFGVRLSVSSTVYGSRAQTPVGTPSVAWPGLDATGRNGTAGAITSVLEGTNGYAGSESTANSTVATVQTNNTQASSYNQQVAAPGTTDFGTLSQWGSIEGHFGGGPSGTALDLYRIASGGVTLTGTFTISDTGAITFAAPIPEPGAALLLGAAGISLTWRRRRSLSPL